MKHKGKDSLKVAKTIKEEEKHRKFCQVVPVGNGQFQVVEHKQGHHFDMIARTRACRR